MQELEKILEEIDEMIKRYKENPRLEVVDICYGLNQAKNIIRKHLSRENGQEITSCSRDNDGWIPVEKRLPEEKQFVLATWEKPNYRKNVTEIYISILKLIHDKEWYGDCGIPNGKVTAWRPLPEPYRPERSGEE